MSSSTATASTGSNAEEAPQPLPLPLIPSLSDDVSLNCLARVPRSYHPRLSLASKTIRSILSSPLLYATRSLLGCTQPFLYVSLRLPTTPPSTRWFNLYQNPPQALAETKEKNNKKTGNLLIPIPSIPSPTLVGSAFVAVGPEIYVIGGSVSDVPSSLVWILDCRFHTWRAAPSMRVGREFAAAGVVDGKIYVIGGCVVDNWSRSRNWAEAFDPKTQSWEPVPSPEVEVREKWMHGSAVMEGKVYAMADRNGVVYEPKEGKWDTPEKRLDLGWRGKACVIENVLYSYDYLGKIRGYDPKERLWRQLKGVEGLPNFLSGATMAEFGGKLAVLWEGKTGGGSGSGGNGNGKEMEIWCAEIAVERREGGEIWGRVEWSDVVLTVPRTSAIVLCLAVTL